MTSKASNNYNAEECRIRKASKEEGRLYDLVGEYSEEYFPDFRFERNTICSDFTKVHYKEKDGQSLISCYSSVPYDLESFNYTVLDRYHYKVEELEGNIVGQVNNKEHSITISPEVLDSEDCKRVILHEIIHMYEEVIDQLPKFYHDILLICLYNFLKDKVDDLDERIKDHTHVIRGDKITNDGGDHDMLFFLKSLDLDFQCGYNWGTVCGYGRDQF